jgi:hypothetical protein
VRRDIANVFDVQKKKVKGTVRRDFANDCDIDYVINNAAQRTCMYKLYSAVKQGE